MADQEKDRQVDALLDSLLATYSDVEPRPGFETRLAATVREQPPKAIRWRYFLLAGAAVTAAVLAMVIYLHHPAQVDNKVAKTPERQAPEHNTPVKAAVPDREMHPIAKKAALKHEAEPRVLADVRKDVFPSPAPLTEEERLLMRYVARTPRQEVVAQSRVDPEVLENPEQGQPNPQMLLQMQQGGQPTSNTR